MCLVHWLPGPLQTSVPNGHICPILMRFLAMTQQNSEDTGFLDCDFLVLKIIEDHLEKKKIKRLHKLRWDFTDIQADFRRQLENRTLLRPPSPFPNKCHMSVHDAFWLTALWLTFDTEKMPKHLGPSFPFSSLLVIFNTVEGKMIIVISRTTVFKAVHRWDRSLVNSGYL